MPEPPPTAERRGSRTVSSPVPERTTPKRVEPTIQPGVAPGSDRETGVASAVEPIGRAAGLRRHV